MLLRVSSVVVLCSLFFGAREAKHSLSIVVVANIYTVVQYCRPFVNICIFPHRPLSSSTISNSSPMMLHQSSPSVVLALALLLALASVTQGFQIAPNRFSQHKVLAAPSSPATTSSLFAATMPNKKKGYEPKWKKKATLADQLGAPTDLKEVGLIGTIPVVFKQGNQTKTTMALAGQPLRDVASQAGQFIQYGCGKGECGTCETLCDGKWIRPCSVNVPADLAPGQELVLICKEVKAKAASSGKFYSIRSFLFGFWNNILGMFGMLKFRRAAKKNWQERQEYEDSIKKRTEEKKRLRAQGQSP